MSKKKVKEATFGELIKFMDEVGWDKGFKMLEKNLHHVEWLQADLYGHGDSLSIKNANALSPTIIKMQISMGNLRRYAAENNKIIAP